MIDESSRFDSCRFSPLKMMKPDDIIGIALRDIEEGGTIEIPVTLKPSGVSIDDVGKDIWLSPKGEEWIKKQVNKKLGEKNAKIYPIREKKS